jgi:hypothetical protein
VTLVLVMLLVGSALIYGGWKNLSIKRLLLGDNTTQKT